MGILFLSVSTDKFELLYSIHVTWNLILTSGPRWCRFVLFFCAISLILYFSRKIMATLVVFIFWNEYENSVLHWFFSGEGMTIVRYERQHWRQNKKTKMIICSDDGFPIPLGVCCYRREKGFGRLTSVTASGGKIIFLRLDPLPITPTLRYSCCFFELLDSWLSWPLCHR